MFKRLLFLFIYSLIFLPGGFAQEKGIGKMRQKLNAQSDSRDTATVNLMNALSTEYLYLKPDSMVFFAKKALEIARAINYPLGEANAMGNLARVYYVKGSYLLSLRYALDANRASEKINDLGGMAYALNCIGLIHLTQNKFEEANRDFLKALSLAKRLKNNKLQASLYLNLGISAAENKNPKMALKHLSLGLDLCRLHNMKHYESMILNRIAETYSDENQHEAAMAHYRLVLKNKPLKNDWEYSFAHSGMARIQLQKGLVADAIQNATQALQYAQRINAKFDISRSLKVLHAAYAKENDFENAYKYLEMEKLYSDSLFNEAKEKEINRLNLEKKQSENIELKKLIDQNKKQIQVNENIIKITAGLAVFLLILSILVFRFYRQKSALNEVLLVKSEEMVRQNELIRKQNSQLDRLNKTKDQLFAIIGHDLRGPFGTIIQVMNMIRSGEIDDKEMGFFLNKFYETLSDTSHMLDNLVSWASNQQQGIKTIPTNLVLSDHIDPVLRMFETQFKEKQIDLHHTKEIETGILADPDHLLIMLRNLIANAIKFTPVGGSIDISYSLIGDKLAIHIKDSGIGMSADKINKLFRVAGKEISSYGTKNEKGIGIGLLLVKQFADENDADIKIWSELGSGTEFIISFKRSNSEPEA